jgi:hypothetical protein
MSGKVGHTKTPYDIGPTVEGKHQLIVPTGEPFIAGVVAEVAKLDDAYFIRNACNSHDELLEALQLALEDMTGPITSVGIRIRFNTLDKVRAAIKKAGKSL